MAERVVHVGEVECTSTFNTCLFKEEVGGLIPDREISST